MRRSRQIVPDDSPQAARELAASRTRELVKHYGENIFVVSLESLAASCYLQGIRDAVQADMRLGTINAPKLTLSHELPKP